MAVKSFVQQRNVVLQEVSAQRGGVLAPPLRDCRDSMQRTANAHQPRAILRL
jgi:hypothetical protein